MRRQDIKVGVVYAYREGNWGRYKKCVFLLPATVETLYTTDRWKNNGWIRDKYRKQPSGNTGYSPATGWIVAIGEEAEKGSLQEALEGGHTYTAENQYEYKLVTTMSRIHGEYDTLVAAEKLAEELRQEEIRARNELGRNEQAVWVPMRDELLEYLPGKVELLRGTQLWEENRSNINGSSHPDHLRLDKEATTELLCLINSYQETITRLENRVHQLEP